MSTSKASLKAAKAALDAHNYNEAIKEASKVLEADSKSYHALVCIVTCLNILD